MSTGGAPLGNQNAAKARKWREAIERSLARNSEGKTVAAGLDQAADKLVALMFEGDKWAIDHAADRIDGKVPQALIGGDETEPPIRTVTRIELVDLDGSGPSQTTP